MQRGHCWTEHILNDSSHTVRIYSPTGAQQPQNSPTTRSGLEREWPQHPTRGQIRHFTFSTTNENQKKWKTCNEPFGAVAVPHERQTRANAVLSNIKETVRVNMNIVIIGNQGLATQKPEAGEAKTTLKHGTNNTVTGGRQINHAKKNIGLHSPQLRDSGQTKRTFAPS